jgi:hypothetical protein
MLRKTGHIDKHAIKLCWIQWKNDHQGALILVDFSSAAWKPQIANFHLTQKFSPQNTI